MSEWCEVALGDVLTLQRGFDLPTRARSEGPFPIVSSAGVTGCHSEYKVDAPGVVIGRYGSLGSVHWVEEPFWPLNTALWVKDFKGNDKRFVSYLLKTVTVDGSTASAVPGVNRNHLHRLPVRRPALRSQRRIAAVLAAFDELIEINERRIELLEDLARSLYREWFVRFRFPGYENVDFVNSELGPVPDGWNVLPLGNVSTNLDRRRRPLSKAHRAQRSGDYPYYGAAKLIDHVDGWIFDGQYLLFAEDGTVQTSDGFPVLQLVAEKFWANNHTHILEGDTVSTRYLYLAASHHPISGYVTGAAQPKITQANLNRLPVLVAPEEIRRAFDAVVDPLLDSRHEARSHVAALTLTRDLLLPRLVTGRLDISDVDLGDLLPAEGA